MPKRKHLIELMTLIHLRGKLTREQKQYARAEERAMQELYPIPRPSEEKRFSQHRTLDKYIGEHAAGMFIERKFKPAA